MIFAIILIRMHTDGILYFTYKSVGPLKGLTHDEIQQAFISQSTVKCALHKASFALKNHQLFGLYPSSHDSLK